MRDIKRQPDEGFDPNLTFWDHTSSEDVKRLCDDLDMLKEFRKVRMGGSERRRLEDLLAASLRVTTRLAKIMSLMVEATSAKGKNVKGGGVRPKRPTDAREMASTRTEMLHTVMEAEWIMQELKDLLYHCKGQ